MTVESLCRDLMQVHTQPQSRVVRHEELYHSFFVLLAASCYVPPEHLGQVCSHSLQGRFHGKHALRPGGDTIKMLLACFEHDHNCIAWVVKVVPVTDVFLKGRQVRMLAAA